MGDMTVRRRAVVAWRRLIVGMMAMLAAMGGLGGVFAPQASANPTSILVDAGIDVTTAAGQFVVDNFDFFCAGQDDLVNCGVAIAQGMSDVSECVAESTDEADVSDTGRDEDTGVVSAGGVDVNAALDCLGEKGFGLEPEEEEETDEASPDYSIHRMTSALASLYSNTMGAYNTDEDGSSSGDDGDAPTAEDVAADADSEESPTGLAAWGSLWGSTSPGQKAGGGGGTAGSFVGYPDPAHNEHNRGLFSQSSDDSSVSVSHDAYQAGSQISEGKRVASTDRVDSGVYESMLFGSMLNSLGLDSTSEAGIKGMQVIPGVVMLAAFVLTGLIDVVFDGVISILNFLNPFHHLLQGFNEQLDPRWTGGITQGTGYDDGAFSQMRDFIAMLYGAALNFGWFVVIPLVLAFTVIGGLFLRRFDWGKSIKGVVIRIFFMALGVALVGVTFTGGMNSLVGVKGATNTSTNSTRVVLSGYVDFESWMMNARLALPEGAVLEWDDEKKSPTPNAQANARQTALQINANYGNEAWRSHSDAALSNDAWMKSLASEDEIAVSDAASLGGGATEAYELLLRYIRNDQVNPGDMSSAIQGALASEVAANPDQADMIRGWVTNYNNLDSLMSMTAEDLQENPNPLISVKDDSGYIAERSGSVITFTPGIGHNSRMCLPTLISSNGFNYGEDVSVPSGNGDGGGNDPRAACNMAPLAAYNYLNTVYDPGRVTIHSSGENARNVFVRQQHNSVTQVGTGWLAFAYWWANIMLLSAFVVIGLGFAMSMLVAGIKRSFGILGNVVASATGALGAIVKVVAYSIALFVEVLGTIILYKLVQEFLMALPQVIEEIIYSMMGALTGSGSGSGVPDAVSDAAAVGAAAAGANAVAEVGVLRSAQFVAGGVALFSGVLLLIITIMAMKFRSAFLEAIDEAINGLINRFVGTDVSSGSGGNPSGLRQGMARGLGMATMASVAGGGFGGGDAAAGADEAAAGEGTGDGTRAGYAAADGSTATSGEGFVGAEVDADGNIVDADGQPVLDAEGNPMAVGDVGEVDADGNLVDANGNTVVDANGNPMRPEHIGGINEHGHVMTADGTPMVGSDGSPLSSPAVTAAAASMMGAGAAAAATGATSSSLRAEREMATQLRESGGLSQAGAAGAPVSPMGPEGAADGVDVSGAGAASGAAGDSNRPPVPVSAAAGAASAGAAAAGVASAGAAAGSGAAAAGASPVVQVSHAAGGVPQAGAAGATPGAVPMSGAAPTPQAPAAAAPQAPQQASAPVAPGMPGAPGAPAAPGVPASYTPVAHTTSTTSEGGSRPSVVRQAAGMAAGSVVTQAVAGGRGSNRISESLGGKRGRGAPRGGGSGMGSMMGSAMGYGMAQAATGGAGGAAAAGPGQEQPGQTPTRGPSAVEGQAPPSE